MIPCIINSRLFDLETTEWEGAFSTAIDENNGNRHYVSKRYYFFRNLYDTENTSGLINIQFDENFNTNDSELSSGDQTIGFEEILSYIKERYGDYLDKLLEEYGYGRQEAGKGQKK